MCQPRTPAATRGRVLDSEHPLQPLGPATAPSHCLSDGGVPPTTGKKSPVINSTIRTALILGSLAGSLAQQASADTVATQRVYGDELQRCVVALRPEAAEVGAATVRHTVTEVTVRGVWREFTIESACTAVAEARLAAR